MIDLSIIIVSYNTKQILVECVESIARSKPKISYQTIVVDNDSSDESGEAIRNLEPKIPRLKLIENKENLGFSKANNIGVKYAQGRYVLFLNSDTVMREHTLDAMVQFMDEHQEAGAATCKVELPNGKLDDASHRGFPTPWSSLSYFSGLTKLFPKAKLFGGYWMGWEDLDSVHEIDALAGAFMIVRKEAGDQVGWWDEDFFWYGEDLDFCFRLKEKGWKIYYVPAVSILHYKGVSGGIKKESAHLTSATDEIRRKAMNARFAAMDRFYDKHYKKKYPKIITFLVKSAIRLRKWVYAYPYLTK